MPSADRLGARLLVADTPAGLAWGALWRAQAAHLAVFAVGPTALALLQLAWAALSLPFMLVGAGDRDVSLGVAAKHLSRPGCWLMLAPCALAPLEVFDLGGFSNPATGPSGPAAGDAGEPQAINVRQLWFALWLGWLVVFLVRRERRRGRGLKDSPDG